MAERYIHVNEVANGYVIRSYEVKDNKLHFEPSKEHVAGSKADVKKFVDNWLDKKSPPKNGG